MKKVRILKNETGFVKFIFIVLVLACIVYVGIKVGMPYYKYSAFKSDAKELARISIGDTGKTKEQLLERVQDLGLPIKADDIQIIQLEKTVRVKTSWSETVDLLGLYQKKFDFTVDVEG
ncbi:MAG: hypothetical protein A2Y97_09725 [Nitrospirae bacterium RBG_13_39_12]|nr:MAG: hypothetical protein A2Y97_09725 [Nitrospirae bacterium RBG_13_39_12]